MIKGIICCLLGHSGSPVERLSEQAVKVHCDKCGRDFAYHHVNRILLPWDLEMQEFYKFFNTHFKTDSNDEERK